MTTTPDTTETETEPTEQEEALYSAVANELEANIGFHSEERVADFLIALADPIAEIRRHAAADALRRKAKSFDNTARMFRYMSVKASRSNDPESSQIYWVHANQARTDAEALRKEADGIIAEGYEWQCASGSGCCAPVPDAGDMCPECDAAEYDDRWAE